MEARKQSSQKNQQPLLLEAQQFCKASLGRCLSKWTESVKLIPVLQGSLIAAVALFWTHLFVVTWGLSQLSIAALGCGLMLALIIKRPILERVAPEFCSLFLFAATSTSVFWWEKWDLIVTGLLQNNYFWGLSLAVVLNGLLLSLMIVSIRVCSQSAILFSREEELCKQNKCVGTDEQIPSAIYFGAALGLWIFTWSLNVLFPVYQTAAVCSGFLLILFIAHQTPLRLLLSRYLPSSNKLQASTNHAASREKENTVSSPFFLGALSFCAGWLLPAMYRVMSQLQPETTLLFYGTVAAVLLGLACSRSVNHQLRILHLAAYLSLALLAFPLWIRFYLMVSASVSSTLLAISLRQMGVIALFLPIGIVLGRVFNTLEKSKTESQSGNQAFSVSVRFSLLVCFLCGVLLAGWSILQVGLPIVLTAGLLLLAAGSILFEYYWNSSSQVLITSHYSRIRLAGLCIVCLMSFGLVSVYQPGFATHTLFSSHVFNAWRNGTSISHLCGIDDGRLLAVRETPRGTLTLWKHQGEHIQLRRNGIPAGRISKNDELVPQPTGELLSSALPLSIHPSPRNILHLGMESGLAVQVTLEFPVMNVTCVESDSGILEQAKTGELSTVLEKMIGDKRLRFKTNSPAIAIRMMNQKFDVVIDSPGHSAVYANAAGYDLNHYQHIAKLLSEHGLYCQRFTYSDYGPVALAEISKTMREAFGYVTAFDTAPGEMLFVAARVQEDIFSEGLITRISSPQTRRILARIGWDWSVAMNLGRFDIDQIDSLKHVGINTTWQGTGSFGLSVEMMRWGTKWNDVRRALASHSERLLNHYEEDKETDDILRRLSDVTACRQIIREHPDKFWAYRKTVKKRLTDKPRSVILPVKGEGLQRKMHPEDKRRLEYFEALGAINKKDKFTPADLQQVTRFAYPYDPLISYYIHPELARLYQRSTPPEPSAELRELLHTIYFSNTRQRSVRDIHRSLELLSTAEVSMSQADRYDHINTLLEILKQRWITRRTEQGISQAITLIDLKNSLSNVGKSLKQMEQFADAAGVDEKTASIRQQELKRSLQRMLRSYRAETMVKSTRAKYPTPETKQASEK